MQLSPLYKEKLAEVRQSAREEGREEGIEVGALLTKLKMIPTLLELGLTIEQTAQRARIGCRNCQTKRPIVTTA